MSRLLSISRTDIAVTATATIVPAPTPAPRPPTIQPTAPAEELKAVPNMQSMPTGILGYAMAVPRNEGVMVSKCSWAGRPTKQAGQQQPSAPVIVAACMTGSAMAVAAHAMTHFEPL
mmetsp:Transcript_54381/g.122174  ORF Transcript_54381/g.122174 Transcript_54381/m.122174 type:complete len:117 (-) Transcript_54381:11-361(-)